MEELDVVVVGGGPGGSACARRLREAGVDVLVLDRAEFPRTKLCAGWVTPDALADLDLQVEDYPHSFLTFERIHVHWKALHLKPRTVQHSIRRYEFDDFLLKRSGAPVANHYVKQVRADGDSYIVDDQYRCRYLVGAGGTKCPVYKALFRSANPRAKHLQTVTYEHEFPYEWEDGDCHLWFFENSLPGYAWYVPKANGHLNVGLGGMAEKLKLRGGDIKEHWGQFTSHLGDQAFVRNAAYQPTGYSYYLRGNVETVRVGNAFVIGDAAGLATRDLCEGIGPAVKSGQLAAESIISGAIYQLDDVVRYSAENRLVNRLLEYGFAGGRH